MKFKTLATALLASSLFAMTAFAQDAKTASSDQPATCDSVCESTCESGVCPAAKAMAALPKMTYQVGTEATCCAKSAAALAEKNSQPVEYLVSGKKFAEKEAAYVALVEETESFVDSFVTPKKCSASKTTTIAGKKCGCSVEAGKRTELVSAAVKDVKLGYKVGGKSMCCGATAAAVAKKSGDATTYLVGEEEFTCNYTARLNLAKAKYAAAVKALAATEAEAPKTTTSTEKPGSDS